MSVNELATRLERRFTFTKKELGYIIATVLVAAFILSFRTWGGDEFNLSVGLGNLIIMVIIVFISIMIHFSIQKIIALAMGYRSEYKYWLNGILLSLIVAFFTYGYVPLFFTGSLWHEPVGKLRMGVFRGGAKHKDLGYISFAGPLANMIIAGLLAPIVLSTGNILIQNIIKANLLIALFSLLPIPTFEKIRQFKGGTTGLYLFIASRWIFVLLFAAFIVYAILIWFIPTLLSLILALVVAGAITIVYYLSYESEK